MTPRLSDHDFVALRDHLAATAGLVFDENRRTGLAVVVAERLRATGAADVPAYLDRLRGRDGRAEQDLLLDRVTVQETHFFRNAPQMQALRRRVLPDLLRRASRRERPLTVWSAGCSTGEEAYTVAMLLLELAAERGEPPHARVLATDVSPEAVRTAARAVYAGRTLDLVPETSRARWLRPRPGGAFAVHDDVRRLVELRVHNLVTEAPPFEPGEVDLVVCRNVTIYFGRTTTRMLIGSFRDVLDSAGYLLLGHSETLWQVSDAFTLQPVGDAFVYRPATAAGPRRDTAPAPGAAAAASRLLRTVARRRPASRLAPPAEPPARPAPAAAPAPGPTLDVARAALRGGDYAEAARVAQAVCTADPLGAEAYVVLGQARATMGSDTEAVEALRKAVYLDPSAGHAHFLLGGALARLGAHGAASASFRAAASTLPGVPAALLEGYLGGRGVAELVEVCHRLARMSGEAAADGAILSSERVAPERHASGRSAS